MKTRLLAAMLILASTALVIVALVTGAQHTPDASTTVPRGVSTSAPPAPALSAPGARPMARSVPVKIDVPAIGVHAPVEQVGQNPDRSVQVPPLGDHNLAGWYRYSVTPGQAGPSVIVGHVNSRTGPSVFYTLRNIAPGDRISVKRADGTTAVFRVTWVQAAPKASFPSSTVYGPTKYPSLRLITCGGPFDYQTGHYTDNIIVYASGSVS